jgi:hypothetical protein
MLPRCGQCSNGGTPAVDSQLLINAPNGLPFVLCVLVVSSLLDIALALIPMAVKKDVAVRLGVIYDTPGDQ